MLQENNPDAACMYEIYGREKDGENEQCCFIEIGNRVKSFTHHTSFRVFVNGCIFLPARFRFLRSF